MDETKERELLLRFCRCILVELVYSGKLSSDAEYSNITATVDIIDDIALKMRGQNDKG